MWQNIPPLKCLRAFDAVVRCRSISRAAIEENVSQSAISQSIHQLEGLLQTRLLDRTNRPAALTEQGATFHRLVMDALGGIAQEVEEIRALSQRDEETLTLSCNLGFATYWLMPRLSEYNQSKPHITLNVMTTYRGAAEIGAGVDIAIRFGDGEWPDGNGELLFLEEMIPSCSATYLQRKGPVSRPEQLSQHTLIYADDNDPSWPNWGSYFRHFAQSAPPRAKGSHYSNYVQAVQATLAGEGIMLGWRSVVTDFIASQQLVAAYATVPVSSGYYVLVSSRSKTKKAVIDFLDWLRPKANKPPTVI